MAHRVFLRRVHFAERFGLAFGHEDRVIAEAPRSARREADLAVDPRFAKNADRVRNRDVLVPLLEDIVRAQSMAHLQRDGDFGYALLVARSRCAMRCTPSVRMKRSVPRPGDPTSSASRRVVPRSTLNVRRSRLLIPSRL